MDLFPDGAHVWLRSRAHGTYLYANEDRVGVSLSPRRASMNAAWRVHRVMDEETHTGYLLLHGTAYGRYLALSDSPAPRGHRAVQDDYSHRRMPVHWRAIRMWDNDDVLVRHESKRSLRANGKYRPWNTVVTVDATDSMRSSMMRWVVEAIPPRPAPPDLPAPTPGPRIQHSLFRWRAKPTEDFGIRYTRADDDGNIEELNPLNWANFTFYSRSVFNLRTMVAFLENDTNVYNFTLCFRGGLYGRLTPLVVDLPMDQGQFMDIVVLTTGSPAAQALVYPNVDEPEKDI
ncbi:hypothetical protein BS78_10G055900 [Paspalum vaginatum]|nr:hypothetical protein BS78_10G055900 [Paspalum vaginatum]